MNKLIAFSGGLALACVGAFETKAATFEFEEIATTEFLFDLFFLPTINNNDDVAFTGSSALVDDSFAVFVSQGDGSGTQAYETSDGGPIARFVNPPSINDNGVVAYSAVTDDTRSIVAVDDGGAGFTTLDSVQNGGFTRFSSVDINDSGQVVTVEDDGAFDNVRVYDADSLSAVTVFDNASAGTLQTTGGAPGISETGLVAYSFRDFGGFLNGVRREPIVEVPLGATNDTDQLLEYQYLGMADNGAIGYVRSSSDQDTVVLFDQTDGLTGGDQTEIATFQRNDERVLSGLSINDNEEIAFATFDGNGIFETLYLWSGGSLMPILSNGDELDGLEISRINMSNQSLSNTGSLALQFTLLDRDTGQTIEAIYRARRTDIGEPTPVPLPASGVLLLAGLALLGSVQRQS